MGEDRGLITGRETADTLVSKLLDEIVCLGQEAEFFIRFDHVTVLADVAEELVQTLFGKDKSARRITKGKHIVLVNPDYATKMALHRALEAENSMCMVLELEESSACSPQLFYLGKFQPYIKTVLDYIMEKGSASSGEIARDLDLQSRDATHRLAALYDYGLINRTLMTERRLSYVYFHYHPCYERKSDRQMPASSYEVFQPQRRKEVVQFVEAPTLI